MRKLTRTLPLLSLIFLFLPSYVKADPTVITQGSLTLTGISGAPTFSISGQDFSVSGGGSDGVGLPCDLCTPNGGGATFSLSKTLSGDQISGGAGTVNGINYTRLFYEGVFAFTAGTVKIPNIVAPEIELSTPFTLSGKLCARTAHSTFSDGCRPDQADFAFSTQLTGQGVATIRLVLDSFSPNGTPVYRAQTLTYNFSSSPAQFISFTDDFNDNTRDAAKWSLGLINEPPSSFDPLVVVAEKNQRLEISPLSNMTGKHYGGYVSSALWNLTGGSAMVEVLQTATRGADTIFSIGIDSNNWYRFVIEDGRLHFQRKRNGVKLDVDSVPYDPAAHRFLRFRHDYTIDQMVLEASGDGFNWFVTRLMPRDISLEAMRVELSAGTFSPVSNPGTAIFDNFKLETLNSAPATSTVVGFRDPVISVSEGEGSAVDVTVERIGDTTTAFTVDYSTSNFGSSSPCQTNVYVNASERCDYASTAGTLRFAPGETTKTIRIPIIDDNYVEPDEYFLVTLRNPQGASLNFFSTTKIIIIGTGGFSSGGLERPGVNPIDQQDFFIRQQYIDFLGRLPELAGFQFWMNRMSNCPAGQVCDRIDTSLRFFQSDEFRERGFYVYRLYDAVLGRLPLYREFMLDVGRLSGLQTVSEQRQSKDAYLLSFINKSEFRSLYGQYLNSDGSMAVDPVGFVDALYARAGVPPTSRQDLIANLQSGRRTPAQTLEDFILTPEISNIGTKFYDRGFITMQYFGYLRRDPEPAGFNFWVGQLIGPNAPHRLDYRFMVGGFINSDEYRYRYATQ